MSWWQVPVKVARDVLLRPILEGRPQPRSWSFGLRLISALSVAVLGVLVLVAIFGRVLRQWSTLEAAEHFVVLPTWAHPALTWVAVFVISLVLSALLHTHWAVSAVGWFVIIGMLTSLASYVDPRVLIGVAVLGVLHLVLWLTRRRQRWSVWEFVAIWVVLTVTVQGALALSRSRQFGLDTGELLTLQLLSMLGSLAAPALIAAGYAVIELVVTTGQWLAHDLREVARPTLSRWLLAVVLLVGVWRVVETVMMLIDPPLTLHTAAWLGTSAVIVVAVAGLMIFWRLARSRGLDPRLAWPLGQPAMASEAWNPWLWPLALAITAQGILAVPIGSVATTMRLDDRVPGWLTGAAQALHGLVSGPLERALAPWWVCAVSVVAVVIGWRQLRQGRFVLIAVGWCSLATALIPLGEVLLQGQIRLNTDVLLTWATAAALVWLVIVLATGRVHNGTLTAILTVLLIPVLYRFREVLGDPTAALGLVAPWLLLVAGLVWRLLTDGELARRDSSALPREARVLLLLSNAVLAMAVLAMGALAGGTAVLATPESWALRGEETIGMPMLMAALLAPFLVSAWSRSSAAADRQMGGQAAPGPLALGETQP